MTKHIVPKDKELENFFINLRNKKIISNSDIVNLLEDFEIEYVNDFDENDLIDALVSEISKCTNKMKDIYSFQDIMDNYFGLEPEDFIAN